MLIVNHYDDYQHLLDQGNNFSQLLSYETKPGYGTMHNSGKGLLVGTRVKLMDGSNNEIVTAMYYDAKGRTIQQKSTNHLGGLEKEYYAWSFSGQVEKKLHEHSAPGKPTRTEIYGYDYDHAERLVRTRYTLNNDPEVLMNKNEYDELGRLKTTTPYRLDNFKSTYAYTVRSWTSRIAGTSYTEDLTYKYNGNVATMQWVQGGTTRNYAFTYDGLSRIKAASFTGPSSENYTTAYGYDRNGNLTSLSRGTQDNLTFNNNSTNQLYNISDSRANSTSNSVYEFKNYSTVTTQEYWYNANGAMKKDLNKGILDITYNTLNLPLKVDVLSPVAEARNEYTYSAGGQKLKVLSKWNSGYSTNPVVGTNTTLEISRLNTQKITDYAGNIIYENGTLKRILTDNGYYENGNYYFYIKNHLGSNVMAVRKDGNIEQHNHYYPFGLTMSASTNQGVQPYKYTGKELDMEHGLMQYDYGARQYDPAVGRFTTMDPLAEKYYSISPYAYCANNPVNRIDPTGRDIIVLNAPTGAYGNGHSAVLIGNNKDGWTYISKDGSKWLPTNGPSKHTYDNRIKSEEDFNNSTYATDYGYTQRVKFSTSAEQDKKAIYAADKASKRWFSALFSNCVDAVSEALIAAGLNPGYTWLGLDNSYADPATDKTPIPNDRFKGIAENNNGDIYNVDIPIREDKNKNRDMSWSNFWNTLNSWLSTNPNIVVNYY